jgi:hypothetical protein
MCWLALTQRQQELLKLCSSKVTAVTQFACYRKVRQREPQCPYVLGVSVCQPVGCMVQCVLTADTVDGLHLLQESHALTFGHCCLN